MRAHVVNPGGETVYGERPLSYRERQLRAKVSKWITSQLEREGRLLVAFTFTCKQAVPGSAGQLVWLTPKILSDALKVYFRRIDWQVYKNASRRREKRIERFTVIEGGNGTGKRLHVHALVLAPPATHMHPTQFAHLLKSNWVSSEWGMEDAYFDLPESPMAAALYLTKTGLDAVDWFNTEIRKH